MEQPDRRVLAAAVSGGRTWKNCRRDGGSYNLLRTRSEPLAG